MPLRSRRRGRGSTRLNGNIVALANTARSERINLRLSEVAKRRIEQAASVEGKTVSGFIVSSALESADEIPRGDMENRIKDCQLDLFANRMSAHAYKANQLRLLLAAFAYVLIDVRKHDAMGRSAAMMPCASTTPSPIRRRRTKSSGRP